MASQKLRHFASKLPGQRPAGRLPHLARRQPRRLCEERERERARERERETLKEAAYKSAGQRHSLVTVSGSNSSSKHTMQEHAGAFLDEPEIAQKRLKRDAWKRTTVYISRIMAILPHMCGIL